MTSQPGRVSSSAVSASRAWVQTSAGMGSAYSYSSVSSSESAALIDTHVRVSTGVVTRWTAISARASSSASQSPVHPPSTATIETSAPSDAAARARFSGFPPARRTTWVGRWIRPSSRWSTT